MERRIQINDNRVLIYEVSEGYVKPTYTIKEGFIKNGDLIKNYILTQRDDYGLNGWINNDENIDKISFEFDKNHPLYIPLFHLLNYDDELLIDDDDTREINNRLLIIRREKEKIYIEFIDKFINSEYSGERFHVFIKNIVPDGRSKIDQSNKDTKKRLFIFFNEVHNLLTNDYHQESIEEYLLNNDKSDEKYKQMKKVFKGSMNN